MANGRRLKLNKTLINKVKKYLAQGCTHKLAAQLSGISVASFYGYLEKAREIEETIENPTKYQQLYLDFLEAVEGGEAQAHSKAVEAWMSAMEHQLDADGNIIRFADWRAAESWLKRRLPEEFGEVSRSEVMQKTTLEADKTTGVMVVPSADIGNFAQQLLQSQQETHLKAKQLVDSADE